MKDGWLVCIYAWGIIKTSIRLNRINRHNTAIVVVVAFYCRCCGGSGRYTAFDWYEIRTDRKQKGSMHFGRRDNNFKVSRRWETPTPKFTSVGLETSITHRGRIINVFSNPGYYNCVSVVQQDCKNSWEAWLKASFIRVTDGCGLHSSLF